MYTIGIAGGTCSGKTTLTAALEKRFADEGVRTVSVHLDRFFKNPAPTTVAPFTGIEYPEHNHPDSFKLDEFYKAIDDAKASDADVVIVEGILVLWLEEARKRLDLKVFIDLPSDERLYRRIVRFMRDRGQTLDEVATRYLDTVKYRYDEFVEPSRRFADLLFNGSAKPETSADILCGYVKSKLS